MADFRQYCENKQMLRSAEKMRTLRRRSMQMIAPIKVAGLSQQAKSEAVDSRDDVQGTK